MNFRTHTAFAFLIGLMFLNWFNNNKIYFLILVLIGSLLPDIDEPRSWIGRRFRISSHFLGFIFGHRKFIHSIFALILLSLIIKSFFGMWWIPVSVGYFSHLLIDGFTVSGVDFTYPFKQLKLSGFIKTGGMMERILFWILIFLDLLLFYILLF